MEHTPTSEFVDEVSKWTAGLGILTTALAPLALPFLILTAVALIPLLIPVIAIGLVAAILYVPFVLIRAIGRRLGGGVSSGTAGSPRPASPASM